MENVILIGAGGHCKVVMDILSHSKSYNIYGVTDSDPSKIGTFFNGVQVVGNDDFLKDAFDAGVRNAFLSIGSTGNNMLRRKLFDKAQRIGFNFINAIHPSAIISDKAILGMGTAVMAGAVVNIEAVIGRNCVLNTGCIIEHEANIGDNVFIAPGCILAGNVHVGCDTFIGLGAKIIQNVNIGSNVLIGAGSVITSDIPDNSVVYGVPGKVVKYRNNEC